MSKTSAARRRAGVFARLATFALLVGGAVLAGASPAAAQTTININPGNVPTTAAAFAQNCDPNLGGGPYPTEDVWVFNLPGNRARTGTFQSITANFNTPSGPTTRTIPTAENSAIVNNLGTSKAWIRLPAGWTLTGATAVISGTAEFFVLTHTCAAGNVGLSLALTKTGTPASGLKAGQQVTYTYTVRNNSTGTTAPITGITVTDDKVTGITCQATSLIPDATTTCTGTYTVTEQDVANGQVVNTAQASGTFDQRRVTSTPVSFTVTTVTPPPAQASLSIDKKARVESDCRNKCQPDGYAAKGDKIFYTYHVTNTGNVSITNVAVVDPTAGAVTCNTTTLAPGTRTECRAVNPYVVTWSDVKKGKVVNTARATGRSGTTTVTSDPDSVTICIRDGKYDHRKHGKDDGKHHGKHHDKHHDKHHGTLPVTGDGTVGALSLGGGLLAVGGLLVGASRLRRRVPSGL